MTSSKQTGSQQQNKQSEKAGRDGLLGSFAQLLGQGGARANRMERKIASELVSGVLSRLEKSKDDIIRLFCRELGVAMAGILKEPLQRLSESRKMQITIEIVPTKAKAQPSGKKGDGGTGRSSRSGRT